MNGGPITGRTWLQLIVGLGVAGLVWQVSGQGSIAIVVLLAIGYLLMLRYGTVPLARYIARVGYSIRWKFEVAIIVISLLFLSVGLLSYGSMGFMHDGLHDIQEIEPGRPAQVMLAVEELEDTQHGAFFSLTPYLGALGVLAGAALGSAMAWSVIVPVRRMGEAMRKIGSGDFSERVEVENDDELGQLAERINETATGLARLQEATHAELRGAQLIQNTLLSKEVPMLPGWQVAAHYRPARAVGGDFYDFIDLPNGQLGVVVGDAADKGVPAALVMATTRSALRAAAERLVSPGRVLARVNDLLCPDVPANMFVTCLYAVLDPASGRIRYANAGHGLPYCHSDGVVRELRATGMPLGLMPGMDYDEKEETLSPGESVLFHSDGLVEAHSPQSEMFGFPRLKTLLAQYRGDEGVIEYLQAELAKFTGADWEQEDDVTLVTLHRSPVPEPSPSSDQTSGGEVSQPQDTDEFVTIAEFSVPSETGNERQVAERVAAAVGETGLSEPRLERLKTAVAEATMNAMEHGNAYRPELPVSIRVSASDTALSVRITDHGSDEGIPDPEEPDMEAKVEGLQTARGWGLYLIKHMVDEIRVGSDDTLHTVELVVYLGGGNNDDQTL